MAKITIGTPSLYTPASSGLPTIGEVGPIKDNSGAIDLANTVNKIGQDILEKRKDAINVDYVADSSTKASLAVDQIRKDLLTNMKDPKGFANEFSAKSKEVYDKFVANAPSDESRKYLQQSFNSEGIANYKNAFNEENKLIADGILSNTLESARISSNIVLDNPSLLKTKLEQLNKSLEASSNVLDPATQRKVVEASHKQLGDAYIQGLMKQDLNQASKFVNSEEAKSFGFDSGEISSYRSGVIAAQKKRAEEIQANIARQIEGNVLNRKFDIFQGNATQLDLDKDLKRGAYGKKEYMSLSEDLARRLKDGNNDAIAIANVTQRASAGLPFDTTDNNVKKDLETYYNKIVVPTLTADNIQKVIPSFIDKYGYIPEKIKSDINSNLYNGSNELKVQSANMVTDLIKKNPAMIRQFSEDSVFRARELTKRVNAGSTPEDAAKSLDNILVERNTTEYKNREDAVKDSAATFNVRNVNQWFRNDPNTVPDEMKAEWEDSYKDYAINRKVDLSSAQDNAYNTVQRNWNVSNVTGTETWVKHAPELYYSVKGADDSWMKDQLANTVKQVNPSVTDYTIAIDPKTIGSNTPAYTISYVNEDGIPLFLTDDKGRLAKWRPNFAESTGAKELAAKEKSILNK